MAGTKISKSVKLLLKSKERFNEINITCLKSIKSISTYIKQGIGRKKTSLLQITSLKTFSTRSI